MSISLVTWVAYNTGTEVCPRHLRYIKVPLYYSVDKVGSNGSRNYISYLSNLVCLFGNKNVLCDTLSSGKTIYWLTYRMSIMLPGTRVIVHFSCTLFEWSLYNKLMNNMLKCLDGLLQSVHYSLIGFMISCSSVMYVLSYAWALLWICNHIYSSPPPAFGKEISDFQMFYNAYYPPPNFLVVCCLITKELISYLPLPTLQTRKSHWFILKIAFTA